MPGLNLREEDVRVDVGKSSISGEGVEMTVSVVGLALVVQSFWNEPFLLSLSAQG